MELLRVGVVAGLLMAGVALPRAAEAADDNPAPFANFGSGLAFLAKATGPDAIEEAVVDQNGYVRVNKRVNTSAGLVLELHELFQPNPTKHPRLGVGPFIGVQASGDSKVINAVGGGILFGFKTADTSSHTSLNIGIGYAGIIGIKSLGDEFVEDAKAPVGSDGKPLPIRYVTHDAGAFMFLASFMF